MTRDQDGGSVTRHSLEAIPELDAQERIDADRGLIEQQQIRLVDEGARQRAPGAHAAAQAADQGLTTVPEVHELERLAHPVVHAVDGREKAHVFLGRQIGVKRSLLRHVSDLSEHVQVRHPAAQDADGSPFRHHQTDKGPDQRRLAGAVRAEQSVDLAAADAKRYAVERTQ